jgi:hypothetical protein
MQELTSELLMWDLSLAGFSQAANFCNQASSVPAVEVLHEHVRLLWA